MTLARLDKVGQQNVTALYPAAVAIARRYKADEGLAAVALCEAVLEYRDGPKSLRDFCLTRVRHRIVDELRRRRYATNLDMNQIASPTELDFSECVPERHRELFRLYWVEGLPFRRVSKVMGLSRAELRVR